MIQGDKQIDTAAIQARVPKVYETWAPGHADGKIITTRPYDSDDEYQRNENVRIEPDISLEIAEFLGKAGLGEISQRKLVAGLEEYEIVSSVIDRHKKHKNSLISTLHLRDTLDTASTHNGLFVASGGSPELAEINDVIANPMMAYLDIGGMAVYRALTTSGGINEALPYRAARDYGMDKEARQYLAKLMKDSLEVRLREGVALHWSLPGTRGVKISMFDGRPAMSVKIVDKAVAEYAVGQLDWALPVPIDFKFGNSKLEVLPPRPLESVDDVHKMMQEMVEVASELSGEEIYYGMPKDAELTL